MTELKYVYVAGPMSGPPDQYLAAAHRMSAYCRMLMEKGLCPINPAGDLLEGIVSGNVLSGYGYKERSMDLLRLLAGREDSELHVLGMMRWDGSVADGVCAEIDEAERLLIPVRHVDWYGP